MSILQRLVTDLKGVGDQMATKLAKLNIHTLQDLLFHFPHKYVDRTRIYPIGSLRLDDTAVIEGIIVKVVIIPKPRRSLSVAIQDSTGIINLRFFHFNTQQQQQLVINKKIRCFGTVRQSGAKIQMIHPEYKICNPDQVLPVEEYLTPIYPTTEGVSQNFIRNAVQQTLAIIRPIKTMLDILPVSIRDELNFYPINVAIEQIHMPTPECYTKILNQGFHPAQKQLAFEELLAHHLSLRKKRALLHKESSYGIDNDNSLVSKLISNLPYTLTNAQQKVFAIIKHDMQQPHPMLRLVQGDVGCGKTLVAVMSALLAIQNGLQVAFMVPTEILAQQHFINICKMLVGFELNICCLSSSINNKQKEIIKQDIAINRYQFIIGTHAIFQNDVDFFKLGLVIIDEQHKFGVAQRLALQKKGIKNSCVPHQLVLTATPIPRTLAMTFYADLDYCVIDELPPGRKPITTVLVSDKRRLEILERIENICAKKQQVYWVCTLISESELLPNKAAEQVWLELQQHLPNLKIALIHSKIPEEQKEQIMHSFKQGAIDVLVATTVIEVGVDVPNASLMVIDNPERLGIAQLHQLRGRVGRSELQSYCVLLYKSPLGARAMQRLQFLRDTEDGFALAEFDLQLRGPGEVFGTKQSGVALMRIADLVRDKDLLPLVAKIADKIMREYPNVIELLLHRWIREQFEYANV